MQYDNGRCDRRKALIMMALICCIGLACSGLAGIGRDADSTELRNLFAQPPRQYSSAPLWVWNDMLTEQQIVQTMSDLASQKVKQVFVHPRPGLMTPYLSDDWFRLWKAALREAQRLDMNVWIYDENSYPSGFAGGLVPEAMPQSRGKGLVWKEAATVPRLDGDVVAVFRKTGDGYENVTDKLRARESLGQGGYLIASIRLAPEGGWFAGTWYVDLLKPGVTEKFIEVTMEAYRRQIGDQFGKRMPGWFTDEPHLAPAGGLHWSDRLPELFNERWGYDLLDHLPSLTRATGDWKRVRHNYYNLLLEQFIERWAKPCYEYCEAHNIEFTGHYWEHGWPGAEHGPDNMAMYAWHQRPAIDTLMNQYSEGVNAQFGNVRAVKELSSVANQLGRERTLCEAYGAGGWDLRFEDMKRIGDWLYVLGVNTLDEHLSYITLRGARKRDHPQSFSYHEPWWDAYHVMAEYFTRLSLIMSSGQQMNQVLVLEPTTTAWMYQGDGHLGEIGNRFQAMVMALERAQVEYDIGCEDIIARHGSVEGASLKIGKRQYEAVVLPPLTENVNAPTIALLEKFLRAGGTVLCCGEPPARVDGSTSDRGRAAAQQASWKGIEASTLPDMLPARTASGFAIERAADDRGILFHHRRIVADGQFLLLVNTSIDSPSAGTVVSEMKGVRAWDLFAGETRAYPFTKTDRGVRAEFELPPSGSLLLFLSKEPVDPAPALRQRTRLVRSSEVSIERLQPNVLTLDYVDITAGGKTSKDIYFYRANQLAWQANGVDRNPWDSAVQFRDELITKTFPPDSGFSASYKFVVEGPVPKDLAIVIERPDLYTVTCNGQSVSHEKGSWWLDKAFGKIAIDQVAKTGENLVTIAARPFTICHELEPAYVLGDFAVKPVDEGFVIVPPEKLTIAKEDGPSTHDVNPDGTMWLSGGIGFQSDIADRSPFVDFDLGRAVDLTAIEVWNYNESHVRDLTSRGVSEVDVLGSASGEPDRLTIRLGTHRLARAGTNAPPQRIRVTAKAVRFIRFAVKSNQAGVTYPAQGEPDDNGFVGLAEVRFFAGADEAIKGVRIHRVSSELASMTRTADHLVDGSGLTTGKPGWRRQGLPFYSADVAYRQQFQVRRPRGQYVVSLPDWHGSVAKVTVNGKFTGHIVCPPWECDVTDRIQSGENEIEVVVVGTLKNTLGPHHNGPGLGSAWPGSFHRAPETGPPPGASYHTVDYGLFEPFVLRQITEEQPGASQ